MHVAQAFDVCIHWFVCVDGQGAKFSEVVKLKAQVLALKQEQKTGLSSQQSQLSTIITQQTDSFALQKQRLVSLSEELAGLRAGLKLE